ncbi:hypothetical protein ACFOY4_01090 [Actinomadura syzygii]|uniref:Uncharacterized protein n=1 Tax=Actinomadura syzygii TaxID=1427538 RepID=A0A5D0TR79_9ACTN|nr:hypothetical protein [Actinomadura syzygii]TYC08648.1 hypothetical protein FXF65_37820 [Actinomadura syzygii]
MRGRSLIAGWPEIRCVAVDHQVLVTSTTNWTRLERVVPSGYEGFLTLNLGVVARLLDTALITDPAVLPVLAQLREAGLEVVVVPSGDSADPARTVPVQTITAAAGRPTEQVCYVGPEGLVDVGPAMAARMRVVVVAPPEHDPQVSVGQQSQRPATGSEVPAGARLITDLLELPALLTGSPGRAR